MKRNIMIPLMAVSADALLFCGCSNDITNAYEEKASGKHRQADMGEFGTDVKIGFVYVDIYDAPVKNAETGRNEILHCNHYSKEGDYDFNEYFSPIITFSNKSITSL